MLKRLDLVVLALALPVFVVAGFPLFGYAVGGVAYLVQRLIKQKAEGRALEIAAQSVGVEHRDQKAAVADMRKVAGLTAGSMIGRGWFTALAIFGGYFAAGQDDSVGLAAAVLVIACFSAYFSTALALRPLTTTPTELPS